LAVGQRPNGRARLPAGVGGERGEIGVEFPRRVAEVVQRAGRRAMSAQQRAAGAQQRDFDVGGHGRQLRTQRVGRARPGGAAVRAARRHAGGRVEHDDETRRPRFARDKRPRERKRGERRGHRQQQEAPARPARRPPTQRRQRQLPLLQVRRQHGGLRAAR
jgi:hypothetical protein